MPARPPSWVLGEVERLNETLKKTLLALHKLAERIEANEKRVSALEAGRRVRG